ncbi:MAG: hypothetical protein WCC92_22095 [Candidatus Korobacteraceae bacterium]
MRTWILLACLLLLSLMTFAQQSSPTQGNPKDAPAGGAAGVTAVGCVNTINGSFSLATRHGDTYRLKGEHDTLLGLNGKEVIISGSVSGSKGERTLQISTIKKMSDTCQY